MNRVNAITASLSALALSASPAFAQGVLDAGVNTPKNAIAPGTSVGTIVSFLVSFIVVVGILAALLYIVLGAFQWITSGGDKTKVESARNHIIAAVIGLVIIALSFVIINIITSVLGIGSITNLTLPTLLTTH
ncbi:MAG: hypothetical protein COU27_01595 [Candidatus Levybacteria bacterium CG10_big_fil_rev_8_21_14_0_10_36_7]|nr:MAG: hypothetical protein COU27_01595 [Candidatus Levybacteria bacterium CG10_big_fil_rev_8_21_14_0_10_36_7]